MFHVYTVVYVTKIMYLNTLYLTIETSKAPVIHLSETLLPQTLHKKILVEHSTLPETNISSLGPWGVGYHPLLLGPPFSGVLVPPNGPL